MTKLEKVLVAYDGSPQSKEALHWAIYCNHHTGAAISVVKVFEPILHKNMLNEIGLLPENFTQLEKIHDNDKKLMADVKEFCQKHGLEITTEILSGHVTETLLNYAKQHGIGLIVTGTRGNGPLKQMLVGSVTSSLVNLSPIPVLVVKNCPVVDFRGGSLIMATLRNLLVAFDGSACSKEALRWAVEIARPVGAKINAVKIRDPLYLTEAYTIAESGSYARMKDKLEELEKAEETVLNSAKAYGEKQGVPVTTHSIDGLVAEALLRFTKEQGIDMVVVGAKGHGALDMLLGSVARSLVHVSEVPVLVVKEPTEA